MDLRLHKTPNMFEKKRSSTVLANKKLQHFLHKQQQLATIFDFKFSFHPELSR